VRPCVLFSVGVTFVRWTLNVWKGRFSHPHAVLSWGEVKADCTAHAGCFLEYGRAMSKDRNEVDFKLENVT